MTKKRINQIVSNAKASLAIEGLTPSKQTIADNKKYLRGEISGDEVISRITKRILQKKAKNKNDIIKV